MLPYFHHAGGYKGYGLGFIVELFCGILSGSAFGSNVRKWKDHSKEADLVSCRNSNTIVCSK